MSKIRINELARQLEVKSREVIDKLHELQIAEKVTHSNSIDEDKAEQLRRYYRGEALLPREAHASRSRTVAPVESDHPPARDNGAGETRHAPPAENGARAPRARETEPQ